MHATSYPLLRGALDGIAGLGPRQVLLLRKATITVHAALPFLDIDDIDAMRCDEMRRDARLWKTKKRETEHEMLDARCKWAQTASRQKIAEADKECVSSLKGIYILKELCLSPRLKDLCSRQAAVGSDLAARRRKELEIASAA